MTHHLFVFDFRKRLFKAGVLASFVALAAAAYWWASFRKTGRELTGDLPYIAATELDFGEVIENETFQWVLTIKNPGPKELTIRRLMSSRPCVTIEPSTLSFQPGETKEITLTMNLASGTTLKRGHNNVYAFNVNVSGAIGDGDDDVVTWRIHGRVRRVISIHAVKVIFKDFFVRGALFSTTTVKIQSLTPLAGIACSCDPKMAVVTVGTREQSHSNGEFILHVTPNRDLPVGDIRFSIGIVPIQSDAKSLPGRTLRFEGKVVECVELLPDTIQLGARLKGALIEETVTLRSRTARQFSIEQIINDCKGITINALDHSQVSYKLKIEIQGHGQHNPTVLFKIKRANDAEQITIPLKIAYYGLKSTD